jgi:hypothetical protein
MPAKKHAVRKYTNRGVTPPQSLASYVHYAMGASSSRRRPRSPTPPSSCNDDDDEAEEGHVIGPEDFIKDPVEEACTLAEALAQTAEAATTRRTEEEADHRAALRAVEAFRAREAARVQALEEALGVSSGESNGERDLPGHRLF